MSDKPNPRFPYALRNPPGPPTTAPAPPLDLLIKYPIENRVYKRAQINLDGYTFRNCAFIGCELYTAKANFHMIDCHFSDCVVYFDGNALRSVQLASLLLGSWQDLSESLRARVEPDGGITIA